MKIYQILEKNDEKFRVTFLESIFFSDLAQIFGLIGDFLVI